MKKHIGALAILFILAATACKKEPQINLTGTWSGSASGIIYRFFDDSRFQQSDMPGKQWVWKMAGNDVLFYGNPERTWKIIYALEDEFQVLELTDTLTLYRK